MKKILSLAMTGILSLGLFCSPCYAAPKQKFSPDEDQRLIQLVSTYDTDWKTIANLLGNNRNPRQCRERYVNYLSPTVNHGPWTGEEDQLLMQKYAELGSKWVLISQYFNNRTDVQLKNRFNLLNRRNRRNRRNIPPVQPLIPIPQQDEEFNFDFDYDFDYYLDYDFDYDFDPIF